MEAISSKTYELPGLRMHALTCGDPENPRAIFLHGFPEYSDTWREILKQAADAGLYAIAPDLRGYGQTDKPSHGYDLQTLAKDVASLIDVLGGGPAHVVGHDWGGAIAYAVAALYPDKTRSLCVVNCPHPLRFLEGFRAPRQLLKSWYMIFFQLPWLPEWLLTRGGGALVPKLLLRSSVDRTKLTQERLSGYAENFSDWRTAHSALAYYREAVKAALKGRPELLPKIAAPFRLVWCEEDVALGKELAAGHDRLFEKPVEVRYLPGVGHFGPLEAPEKVGPLILEHLMAGTLAPRLAAVP